MRWRHVRATERQSDQASCIVKAADAESMRDFLDVTGLRFEFDRGDYEAQLEGLPRVAVTEWDADESD